VQLPQANCLGRELRRQSRPSFYQDICWNHEGDARCQLSVLADDHAHHSAKLLIPYRGAAESTFDRAAP
jgi:hypothetical protein